MYLLKVSDKCLISALYSIDSKALRNYLGIVEIYESNSSKSKIDLIEIIVYGYIKGKLKRDGVSDISLSSAFKVLKDKGINVMTLPGYGNMKFKKKIYLTSIKSSIYTFKSIEILIIIIIIIITIIIIELIYVFICQ